MIKTLLLSSAAGIIGTGLGGLIGMFFGKSTKRTLSCLLAFAAGVMVSIVCFDLIPEALTLTNIYIVVVCILSGVVVVQMLNRAIDRITDSKDTHVQLEELRHQKEILSSEGKKSMLRSGLVMFAAIALHNLPEGMAIGSSASHDSSMGIALGILIALHNIPEGMSIGVPLIEGGMNKWKAVLLTALSGAPTLIGGFIGAVFGSAGSLPVAVALALAGGAMLYVTYCEIMPQVILLYRGRRPAVYTIVGVLLGLILVNIMV